MDLKNMKFILGKKENMTQVFDEAGIVYPVTVVQAGPVVVSQVKIDDTDGYNSVQVGFGKRNEKNLSKATKGHLKDLSVSGVLREFRVDNPSDYNRGDEMDVSIFDEKDMVTVSAISKGKGFQGAVKRHGFAGGPRSHGQKHSERKVGSIGSTGPQRVFKGTRMAGRMGSDRITVKNLEIVKVDKEGNKLFIKGAIPGKRGTLVEVRSK
ncbi:50S ribosomal protein L3 [Patescibacteria group bacterium]